MSAETLRRAAALMRERVEGVDHVTRANDGQPWWTTDLLMAAGSVGFREDADYIASWHPAVALAVADLLDTAPDTGTSSITYHAALAVARAYLGETS